MDDPEAIPTTYDVFEPFTGTVVLVLETPEIAAVVADILPCDRAPTGAVGIAALRPEDLMRSHEPVGRLDACRQARLAHPTSFTRRPTDHRRIRSGRFPVFSSAKRPRSANLG